MTNKVFIIQREKSDACYTLVVADYRSVLHVLSELDGTDEKISIQFIEPFQFIPKSKDCK